MDWAVNGLGSDSHMNFKDRVKFGMNRKGRNIVHRQPH